jgi:hypothetical protein
MEMTIPKTQGQKDFEQKAKQLIEILADMKPEDIQKVIEFAIFIDN